jgi:hypothetical protein
MPRDQQRANQSQSTNRENDKPHPSPTIPNRPPSSQKEDEDFVDIDHEDVEMVDSDHEKSIADDLELQRFAANSTAGDDDDDSEDEQGHMASHPLLSMLTGRLGQRRRGSVHKWDALHPVTQVLSTANVDECTALEQAVFPEHERCSREKVCLSAILRDRSSSYSRLLCRHGIRHKWSRAR